VKESLKGLILDEDKVKRIGDVFRSEMTRALQDQDSSLQMENTYIPELPDGSEEGLFLALDIGGTNFRVILLELHAGKIVREELQHYHIADDNRVGCGLKLFDYLAECCAEFVRSKDLQDIPNLPLGFTFSFPMKHHGLDKGELVTWTKSFNCPNVVGKDVVHLLRESLKKHNIHNIDVVAILNDTTGTLVKLKKAISDC
jgi:hexokinase